MGEMGFSHIGEMGYMAYGRNGVRVSLYLVEREEGDAVGHFRAHALERAQLVAHLRFLQIGGGGHNWRVLIHLKSIETCETRARKRNRRK